MGWGFGWLSKEKQLPRQETEKSIEQSYAVLTAKDRWLQKSKKKGYYG